MCTMKKRLHGFQISLHFNNLTFNYILDELFEDPLIHVFTKEAYRKSFSSKLLSKILTTHGDTIIISVVRKLHEYSYS